jgi:acyl carrier protein
MHRQIRDFIVEFFLFGQQNGLADCDSLLDKGIIDSTGVLELVAFLEKNYAIKIQNDELLPENLDSIDAIVGFLDRKKRATDFTDYTD